MTSKRPQAAVSSSSLNFEDEVMVAHSSTSCQALAAGIYLKERHAPAEGGEFSHPPTF